jgi:ATP/maltotriose-dependent transcriptional regulator MalT/DNA-binding SARP family transcriptional activator
MRQTQGDGRGLRRPEAVAAPALLRRRELEDYLDQAFGKRLTLVTAGAGFGKSTLVAAWSTDLEVVWHTVTERGASVRELAAGIGAALQSRLGTLPVDLATLSPASTSADSERLYGETVAGLLADGLRTGLAHDLVLVVDDGHLVAPGSSAARLLETLVRQVPETVHVVLLSRNEPPFPVERLRGQGAVLEIEAGKLAFSRDEVATLVRDALGEDTETIAIEIHAVTSGWPAAVRLAVENLRPLPVPARATALDAMRRPEGPLFAYLAEEVFGAESEALPSFISRISNLDRFTPGLCEAIGIRDGERQLERLLKRGLLVQAQTGAAGWFELHSLVRDFALESWPLREEDRREVHLRAAEWLDARGEISESLRYLALSGDREAIGRALLTRGGDLLRRGGARDIVQLAELVQGDSDAEELHILVGDAYSVLSDRSRALEWYRRALSAANKTPAALAWRIGAIHYFSGDLDEALRLLSDADVANALPADEALLLATHADCLRLRGDVARARVAAQRALELAAAGEDPRALAAANNAAGNVAELEGEGRVAEGYYRAAIRAADGCGDVAQVARLRTNLSSELIVAGQYDEALSELEAAIPLAELAGFEFALAYALAFRGLSRLALGSVDEAIRDHQAAIAMYRRLGAPHWISIPLGGLGDAYRTRGDLVLARTAYEEAVATAERAGDVQGLVPALAGLARVVAHEEPERAEQLARQAVSASRGWGHVSALLALGWLQLLADDREKAACTAADAAEEAARWRDRAALAESLELKASTVTDSAVRVALLDEAIAIWHELKSPIGESRAQFARARLEERRHEAEQAERRMRALGVAPRAATAAGLLATLPREERLEIRCLGGFHVVRGGRPIPLAEWRSKKARDLLKILASHRGRPVPRDALMEALWPGEDPWLLGNRLSNALSMLRTALDPPKRYPAEHYVRADAQAVALDLGHVSLDVELFLADAAAGLALRRPGLDDDAVQPLEIAEGSYAGDFLEEDGYEDWAVPLREEARSTYIAVARELAKRAQEQGDHVAAARYLLRILARDAYDEQASLNLVEVLAAAGRHGEARRSYRIYARRMDEIGVEASPFPVT